MIDRVNEEAYFAAANSGNGFVSFFDEIFYAPQIVHRYVIKGGPGTGKSSFLRRVAKHAQMKGKGVRYYYCSSDTDSLDGVIIDGRIALLDGTAPHSCDTALAGACDEIINLGDFWNTARLVESRERISEYAFLKKREYACAYSYLCAASKTAEAGRSLSLRFAQREKLSKNADKICGRCRAGSGSVERMQISAFGVKGGVRLDTLKNAAEQIYAVEDYYGVGVLFMLELLRTARLKGCDVAVSYDTVSDLVPDEILFLDTRELFYLCRSAPDDERTIKCQRFVDKNALSDVRAVQRASAQAYDTLLSLAAERLAAAGRAHALAEQIYVEAMDFDGVQRKCNATIGDIERYY